MFPALLEKLQLRQDLTVDEAGAAMEEIMEGRAQPAHIAGLLIGLAMKGERPAEIVGFAQTMRRRATRLGREHAPVFDTCGTGGDRAHTFNVSTVAALVLAACGVRVAKHGNRSVSSRCGSADLFEELGVHISAAPAIVERCLDEAGIAFFFAPTFHPSMRHAGPTRKELGVRTAFNLLGPLTNPAGASRQLVGVPRPELTELVARSLALLGSERAWVVHGADGLDEISTTGYTKVSECRAGAVNTFYVHPADFRLPKADPHSLRGGDAGDNAAIARAVLSGERGSARDIVVLNAAASLLIAGRVSTILEGIALGGEALDSGAAAATLALLVRLSNEGKDGHGVMITDAGNLLATIVAATRRAVETREAACPAGALERGQTRTPDGTAFEAALRDGPLPRIIAECKRRSPSRGILRERYDAAVHARSYADAGAAAISVLTEPTFFDGAPEHLRAVRAAVTVPLLRKDFIVSDYQLVEAAALGADAILLIVGALSQADLTQLIAGATSRRLAVIVEVHALDELGRAIDAGARIVGVNSRNLRTLGVDPGVLDEVSGALPSDVIAVAESGIRTGQDLTRLSAAGYHAFLVGERLMTQPDPGAALRELRGA